MGWEWFGGESRYHGSQNRSSYGGSTHFSKTDDYASQTLDGWLEGRLLSAEKFEIRLGAGALQRNWRRRLGRGEGADTVPYMEDWTLRFLEARTGLEWTDPRGSIGYLKGSLLIPIGGRFLGANGLDLDMDGGIGFRGRVGLVISPAVLVEGSMTRFSIRKHEPETIVRVPEGEASYQIGDGHYPVPGPSTGLQGFLPDARMLQLDIRVGYRF